MLCLEWSFSKSGGGASRSAAAGVGGWGIHLTIWAALRHQPQRAPWLPRSAGQLAAVRLLGLLHGCRHPVLPSMFAGVPSDHTLRAGRRCRYSCVAVSANNQLVTPRSNVLEFDTQQAE